MERIAIADVANDEVEVDLWGTLFTVKQVTKANEDAIDKALADINKRSEKRDDLGKDSAQIEVFGERMDVWLSPAAGGKKKASTVIKEKWEANELTLVQVNRFWANVQEAINRPT